MWMNAKDVSQYLRISNKTLYYFVQKGLVPHYRIGKLVRFRKEELDAWMQSKKVVPLDKMIDKIAKSFYSKKEGKPDRLGKEAKNNVV